jgi:hypothetical protein
MLWVSVLGLIMVLGHEGRDRYKCRFILWK